MNCNVAGNNVRINEMKDSIVEIAVIDRACCSRAAGKFTRRLQVYKVNVKDPNSVAKKAIMITEPPLFPFSSDWRYVDGELVFLRNKLKHIQNREEILTTLSFLSVDYETGIVCRNRQEEAHGSFHPIDWPRNYYKKKGWAEFLQRFRSAFYLKRC